MHVFTSHSSPIILSPILPSYSSIHSFSQFSIHFSHHSIPDKPLSKQQTHSIMWLNNVYDPESSTTGDNIREGILWNHNTVHGESMLGDFMGQPCTPIYVSMKNDMYVILYGVCFLCHCNILFVGLSCWKTTQCWTNSLCRL